MEQSRASKSHFWAALFKPHISILDISLSAGGGGVHISLGITPRPFYQEDARITLITSLSAAQVRKLFGFFTRKF